MKCVNFFRLDLLLYFVRRRYQREKGEIVRKAGSGGRLKWIISAPVSHVLKFLACTVYTCTVSPKNDTQLKDKKWKSFCLTQNHLLAEPSQFVSNSYSKNGSASACDDKPCAVWATVEGSEMKLLKKSVRSDRSKSEEFIVDIPACSNVWVDSRQCWLVVFG